MKIGIYGSGFVGRCFGDKLISEKHDVIFYDINPDVVQFLKERGNEATSNFNEISQQTEIDFVCASTPQGNSGSLELKAVKDITTKWSESLSYVNWEKILVIKSTLIPSTTSEVIIPLIEKISQQSHLKDFGIVVNPEFITEISSTWTNSLDNCIDYSNENRIVLGESSEKKWGDYLINNLFSEINIPIYRMDYTSAELVKLISNGILATKISYWNEIYLLAQELDIDTNNLVGAVTSDPRIGEYGSVHGKAFGGKCLPKDLKSLINFFENYGNPRLLKSVYEINNIMIEKYGMRE